MSRERRYYCVYIMGSLSGTLYIGFSGNLHKRIFQHKFHHFEGFTDKYDVTRLLYWESYDDVHKALARETQLKGWTRAKKIALIVRRNPHWVDLAADWYPWMRDEGRDASTPQCMTNPGVLRSGHIQNSRLDRRPRSTTGQSWFLPGRRDRRSAACSVLRLRGGAVLGLGSERRCRR